MKARQLLIAGVTNSNEVCLWAVDSDEIYLREMRTWECYGSGIDAAEMLMKDFYYQEIAIKEAIPLLIYIVHAVSDICIDCGGPVSVVVINKDGVRELSAKEIELSLSSVKPLLDKMRKELPKLLLKGQLTEDKIRSIKEI